MTALELVSSHGNGQPHRRWPRVLSTDDPWSFWIPTGSPVVEANGTTWSSPYPVAAMFWPREFYQVFLLLKEDTTEYYCNVITPPRFEPNQHSLLFRDLELDVYVTPDGAELRDVAEFEASRADYPGEWSLAAWKAGKFLLHMGRVKSGPFSHDVAKFWRKYGQMM